MIVFWRLLFGHFLADFTLQSNFINRWKRSSRWGMLVHCSMHPLCYAVLTFGYLGRTWIEWGPLKLEGWACLVVIFLAHWLEDEWRVFTIFRYHTPDNTLYFIWDQIIHYVVIALMIPLGTVSAGGGFMPEKWPVLGCLAVLTTHAATVFIYFVEKDVYGAVFPSGREKYLGMSERLGVALSIFALSPVAAAGAALAWTGAAGYARKKGWLDVSLLNLALGTVIAVSCGAAARLVFR